MTEQRSRQDLMRMTSNNPSGACVFCLSASALFISMTMWLALWDMQLYRGLSGIDSAVFALPATWMIADWWQQRDWGNLLYCARCASVLWQN